MTAILLIQGPLRRGAAATLTDFVYRNGGRIVYHEQHVDRERQLYFSRLEWDLDGFAIPRDSIGDAAQRSMGARYGMACELHFSDRPPRLAVFVSKLAHCLYDIVGRWHSGEWQVEIPAIVSNHPDIGDVARRFGIPFHCFPIQADNKRAQERAQLKLLRRDGVELVVLARYMQILGEEVVAAFPSAIINVHHAFLPAFPGAKPYHAAHRRGVKMIGATSHYVTAELDAGPIIEQDVVRVSHVHTIEDMVRIGRDLEKSVLARAVWAHLQRKILVYDGRTVVFP